MPDAIENTENAKLAARLYLSKHSYVIIYNGITGWGVQLIEGDGFIPVETFDSFSIQSFSLAIAENIQSDKRITDKYILLEFDKRLKRILWDRLHSSSTGDWNEMEKLSIRNSGEIHNFEKGEIMKQQKKPGTIETIENGIMIYLQEGRVEIDFSTPGWLYRLSDSDWAILTEIPEDILIQVLAALEPSRSGSAVVEITHRALIVVQESRNQDQESLMKVWKPVEFTTFMPRIPLCIEKAKEERRTLLTEECSEVIKSLCKIDRFGEVNEYAIEIDHLEVEIGDLFAAISYMVQAKDIDIHRVLDHAKRKLTKINCDKRLMSKQDPFFLEAAEVCVIPATQQSPSTGTNSVPYFDHDFYFRHENGRWEFHFKHMKDGNVSGKWLTLSELSIPQLLVARDTMSTSESDFPGSLKESINAELSLRSYDD